MKILAVCSTLDFKNFVRRATLETIWRHHPETGFLFYTGLKNAHKKKKTIDGPSFYSYHFWVPEAYKTNNFLTGLEHTMRGKYWRAFFDRYDVLFLMDPNQYYLLEYVKDQKVVYLLRDPNILLNEKNYDKEIKILELADLILAISKNLGGYYLDKYYGKSNRPVKIWSNSVDLKLWDYNSLKGNLKHRRKPVVGLGGNLTFVNDLELLEYIIKNRPKYEFRLAGGIQLDEKKMMYLQKILEQPNVQHLGRIPLEEFPAEVINWTIGIVAADREHEYSRYLNNNKQYQYLALGKPFVTFNHDADYDDFRDMVFVAESKEEYLQKIDMAIERSNKPNCVTTGRAIADNHSSSNRANEFLHYCQDLLNKE